MSTVGDFPFFQGGLMRCCIATLGDHMEKEAQEGATLKCDYESDDTPKMILDTNNADKKLAWRWVGTEQSNTINCKYS